MEPIVPRWEWRTFGQSFGPAEARFRALKPEKVQKSSEIYLLSRRLEANVKVRDHLLDIKLLENVNQDGLEQWRPVLKAAFPLEAAPAEQLAQAIAIKDKSASLVGLPMERLLAELSRLDDRVRVVEVSKTRVRYTVGGCVAELTELVANATEVRSAAIEDTDEARVIAAVRSMEFPSEANISYPRGLVQLLNLFD
jgi:exopolyphosphatase/guanosine-5'-triphosphate,3'-diphosphate pyrophosphatase